MKTANDVDLPLSQAMAQHTNPAHQFCYWNAAAVAAYLGDGAVYVEGWTVTTAPVDGALVFVLTAHGWCEKGGKVIDVEGVAGLAYFESSRRDPAQLDAGSLPLHDKDRQAAKRHQRAMRPALDHLLSLGEGWSAITVHGRKTQ